MVVFMVFMMRENYYVISVIINAQGVILLQLIAQDAHIKQEKKIGDVLAKMGFLKLIKQLVKLVILDVELVKKKILALHVHKEEYCHQNVYAFQISLKIIKVNAKTVDSLVKLVKEVREIVLQVLKMMEMGVNKDSFWLK